MHWFCVVEKNLIPSRIGYWIPSSTPQWCRTFPPVDAVRRCQVGSFPKPIPCKGRMTDAMMHRLIRESRHPGTVDLEHEGIVNSVMFFKLHLAKGYWRILQENILAYLQKMEEGSKEDKAAVDGPIMLMCRGSIGVNSTSQCRYGCGSKCKVWIKPRSHKRSRPLIQTPDPDLSKGVDPDLWSRPLEWYNVWASWCLVQWWLHVFGFPALHTLPSSQATNCCKATLSSFQAALIVKPRAKQSSSPAAKLSNCPAHTVVSCKARLPTIQSAHLLPAHLVVLFLSSRPDPDHNQLRSRPQPAPC